MTGLYPIIRRVRRPLLPVDPPKPAKEVLPEQGDAERSNTAATAESAAPSTAETLRGGPHPNCGEQRSKRAQEDDATLF
jgi:hypothetical protein